MPCHRVQQGSAAARRVEHGAGLQGGEFRDQGAEFRGVGEKLAGG